MVDPISLTASLATLGGLASLLVPVSRDVFNAAQGRSAIDDEIRFIACSMDAAADSFNLALESLRCRTLPDNQSPYFQELKRRGTIVKFNEAAKYIERQIKKLPEGIEGSRSWVAFWEAYQWNHKCRPEVTQLITWIQVTQTSMELIMGAAQLESNQYDARRTTDRVYQARLQREK